MLILFPGCATEFWWEDRKVMQLSALQMLLDFCILRFCAELQLPPWQSTDSQKVSSKTSRVKQGRLPSCAWGWVGRSLWQLRKENGLDGQSGSSASESIGPSSLALVVAWGCTRMQFPFKTCYDSLLWGTSAWSSQEELWAADVPALGGLSKGMALWCLSFVPRRSNHLPLPDSALDSEQPWLPTGAGPNISSNWRTPFC